MMLKFLILLVCFSSLALAKKWTYHYSGLLGPDSVSMMLIRDPDTDSLGGMYFSFSYGERVSLYGKISGNHYAMQGVNEKGKKITAFTGNWSDTVISGTFSALAKKKQNYSFRLRKEAPKVRLLVLGPDGKQVFGPVQFRTEQYDREYPKRDYRMTITYPVIAGDSPDAYWEEMFSARMKAFAKARERAFTKLIPRKHIDGSSSSMSLSYSIENDYRFLISVLFREETYVAGAAHPAATSYTFNFDVGNNAWLELGDLFGNKARYLQRISAYCTERLIEKLGDREEVRQGASPQERNFQNFCCTKKGLLIHFDQYQVSSYAEGEHEVLIPYQALKDIIDPASPVMEFMK